MTKEKDKDKNKRPKLSRSKSKLRPIKNSKDNEEQNPIDNKVTSLDANKITKKDPEAEIKPWLDFSRNNKNKKKTRDKKANVGPSLANLKRERRRKRITKIVILLIFSLVAIMGLVYYLSPISLTERIVVKGGQDIPMQDILKSANVHNNEHILGQLFRSKDIEKRLKYDYPSIKSVKVSMDGPTVLNLNIKQNQIMAYLQKGNVYQKVLTTGNVSTETIVPKQLDGKPVFLGYKNDNTLKRDIKIVKNFPDSIKNNLKFINAKSAKQNQIILVMKDQNVIIGDKDTINKKIKFYLSIKKQLSAPAIVDFEIGAFSRPFTETDKKSYLQ